MPWPPQLGITTSMPATVLKDIRTGKDSVEINVAKLALSALDLIACNGSDQ